VQDLTAELQKLNDDFTALNEAAQASKKAVDWSKSPSSSSIQTLEEEPRRTRDAWTKDLADLRAKLDSIKDANRQGPQRGPPGSGQQRGRTPSARHAHSGVAGNAGVLPSHGRPFAAIQIADGTIVRTLPGQSIAYISLGAQDRVKPGMTFAVSIPAIAAYRPTARARPAGGETRYSTLPPRPAYVLRQRSAPIMAGDVIANPVYDRNRQFNFVWP
jgi:hypothetical protein